MAPVVHRSDSRARTPHTSHTTRRCPVCGEHYPDDYAVCPKDATPLGVPDEMDDPLLGRVLAGTYRITRVLAWGGMGRLYEAEHTRLPRRVAVKVIHDLYANNESAVARFEREARAAASIDSDHIVTVHDVIRAPDGRPCIVSELLEGEDLQSRLDRVGSLALSEAIGMARQMCWGLAAAHARGVVHRDLKPSNLFLATRPGARVTLKILDFGVAKLRDAPGITESGAVVGTPAYMAPEQARGASHVDGRVDVYGIGAVLYRIVTGRSPSEAANPRASLALLLEEHPTPVRQLAPSVPEEVEAVLERALLSDPSRRFEDVLALERALRALDATDDSGLDPQRGRMPRERDSTMVLPAGSVDQARVATRRLHRSRPHAVMVGLLWLGCMVLAGTAGVGAALRAISGAAAHSAGQTMALSLLAAVFGVATVMGLWKAFRRRWASAVDVQSVARRLRSALGIGVGVFGGWQLVSEGMAALVADGQRPSPSTLLAGLAVAGLVTMIAYFRLARVRSLSNSQHPAATASL